MEDSIQLASEERPLITFALFAFNQEKYIEEAVRGALSQTYSPLEIILSDDCSPDGTFEIMQRMAEEYDGPHKIILNRNEKNLGLIRHYNKLMDMAKGELIVMAAGDDISLPHRTENAWSMFRENPKMMCFLSSKNIIDRHGNTVPEASRPTGNTGVVFYNIQSYIQKVNPDTFGAGMTVRNTIFQTFGPLKNYFSEEDTVCFLRSILMGIVGQSFDYDNPAVYYRRHDNSITTHGNKNLSAIDAYKQFIREISLAEKNHIITANTKKRIRVALRNYIHHRTSYAYLENRMFIKYFFASRLPARIKFYRIVSKMIPIRIKQNMKNLLHTLLNNKK